MNKYYDYFKEQEHDSADEVTMDEFIAEAMRTDLKFNTLAEELQYQRTSRITLMNELLTCYQYLKDHDMLLLYEAYRNGEELILSRLVDTFISRISLTMLPVPNPHNTACVLSWEEARHWQSRSSGYSSS